MTGYIPSASFTFQCCSSTTSTKPPNRPRNCQSTSVLRIVLHIVFRRDLTADHSTSNAMKSGKWTDECKWIWLEDYDDSAPKGQIVLFRKKFSRSKIPTEPGSAHRYNLGS